MAKESEMKKSRKVSNSDVSSSPNEFVHNGKRYIRIISPNFCRDILLSDSKKYDKKMLFCKDEYNATKEKAKVVTHKDKEKLEERRMLEKVRLMQESKERKKNIQKYVPKKAEGLNEIELEQENKEHYLREKGKELLLELDEEVKKCNSLILRSQCQAIRSAQIAEKRAIEADVAEEKKRLQELWYESQIAEAKELEKEKEIENEKKRKFLSCLSDQVKERELKTKIMADRINEERRLFNEAIFHSQLDEIKVLKEKKENHEKVLKEEKEINTKLQYMAKLEKEERRLQDLQGAKFLEAKKDQGEKRKADMHERQMRKEAHLEDMKNAMGKAQELQDLKDFIAATRREDEIAREWRMKEKETLLRKKNEKEVLSKERQQQIKDQQKSQALEIEQDKLELEKIAKVNEQSMLERQEKLRKIKQATEANHMMLLKQINEKERKRIKSRQEKFEEGNTIQLAQKKHQETVESYIEKKLKRARDFNLPEKCVIEIQRQLLNK